MIEFSYSILNLGNNGDFKTEMEQTDLIFESQSAEKLFTVKQVLTRTDRTIWKCDPDKQIEGTTFVALKKLLQVTRKCKN